MAKPEFVYVTYIATTPEKLWQALLDGEITRQYWGTGTCLTAGRSDRHGGTSGPMTTPAWWPSWARWWSSALPGVSS